MLSISKAADLDYLVQGGDLYRAIPFNEGSLGPFTPVDLNGT
jgi:hypothetical protein